MRLAHELIKSSGPHPSRQRLNTKPGFVLLPGEQIHKTSTAMPAGSFSMHPLKARWEPPIGLCEPVGSATRGNDTQPVGQVPLR